MEQYTNIFVIGLVATFVWLFIDYCCYKWAKASLTFGLLGKEFRNKNVNFFSMGVAFDYLVFTILVILFKKWSDSIQPEFSYKLAGFILWVVGSFLYAITFAITSVLVLLFKTKLDE